MENHLQFDDDVDAAVDFADGVRILLGEGGWRADTSLLPDDADWRARARSEILVLRANAVPTPGYAPDPALARAEAVRDALGGTVIYTRPVTEDPDESEETGLIVY